jgi:hypothetical protein
MIGGGESHEVGRRTTCRGFVGFGMEEGKRNCEWRLELRRIGDGGGSARDWPRVGDERERRG